VIDVLNSFISSEEFENKLANGWSNEEVLFSEPPIDRCISLGIDCFSAWKIKEIGRRTGSFPFDWCFGSPEMLNHVLADKFRTFLDRSYYRPNADLARADLHINQCDHIYYRDEYDVSNVFNHKNPTTETDYSYYERAVARFKAAVASGERILFIVTSWRGDYQLSSFTKLLDVLNDISNNHAVIAINIRQKSADRSGIYMRHRAGNDCLLDFYSSTSTSNGLNLDSAHDDAEFNKLLLSRLTGKLEVQTPHS
jgi:hypothetical protein